ncbi:hypothetical protein B0I37DRAFT_435986 [Chaetomium sp. MPI-CAGE-AT-0009]|nr:hypothetical protein B0I37DRAFT_435986 [Chaetomium sp. MPI-CAGE-AT-0009]
MRMDVGQEQRPTWVYAAKYCNASNSDTDSDSDSDSDTSLAFANLLTTNKLMAEALRAGKHTHTPTHQHQPPPPPATTDTIPTSLFFYGTLQDPTVLQSVTKLTPPLPALQDAHLKGGFDLRLWGGKYPVLVPNPESEAVIRGKLWRVGEAEDRFGAEEWERLRRYETAAYDFVECVVRVGVEDEGDGEGVRAVVFKWAGDGESAELSEGVFDLDVWREKFGGVVFG